MPERATTTTRRPARRAEPDTLTVAVTGPTGDIGRSFIAALERSERVGRILGMARRPFDPAQRGWQRTEYRQGDVLDRASVDALVRDADVVVHLAFLIFGSHEETRAVNLRGSRNVFEAAVAAGAQRLVYTSSVAAYGFDPKRPARLTEDLDPRGTDAFYYSAQKAELEGLLRDVVGGSRTDAYIFRPCIVAGCDALLLIEDMVRQFQIGGRVRPVWNVVRRLPGVTPLVPDSGTPFQLVHHDDVAAALVSAVLGQGPPGVYNLAAEDEITMRDVARELGWRTLPVPRAAVVAASAAVERLPFLPANLSWVHSLRVPSFLDTAKARRELGWRPRYDTRETLRQTVACARETGAVA